MVAPSGRSGDQGNARTEDRERSSRHPLQPLVFSSDEGRLERVPRHQTWELRLGGARWATQTVEPLVPGVGELLMMKNVTHAYFQEITDRPPANMVLSANGRTASVGSNDDTDAVISRYANYASGDNRSS